MPASRRGIEMADNQTWTDDRLKRLETLWKKGLSNSEIGKELGVSRSSVSGKVSRLGWKKNGADGAGTVGGNAPARRAKPIQEMDAGELPLKLALRTIDWSHSKCSWPDGDPKENDFSFCGEEVVPGKPYCNRHCFDAYTTGRESGGS